MEYYLVDKFNRGLYPKHKIREKEKTSSTSTTSTSLNLENSIFNAKRRRIGNVYPGSNSDDVVTVGQTLVSGGGSYFTHGDKYYKQHEFGKDIDAGGKKVINMGEPSEPSDAITMKLFADNCMMPTLNKNKDAKFWNARKMKIGWVGDPTETDEAVNLRTFYKALRLRSYGRKSAYDCQGNRIKGLQAGSDDKDAVNVKQIHDTFDKFLVQLDSAIQKCLVPTKNAIDCKDSLLTNLRAGLSKKDAVIMEQTLTAEEGQPHFFGSGSNVYDLTKLKI